MHRVDWRGQPVAVSCIVPCAGSLFALSAWKEWRLYKTVASLPRVKAEWRHFSHVKRPQKNFGYPHASMSAGTNPDEARKRCRQIGIPICPSFCLPVCLQACVRATMSAVVTTPASWIAPIPPHPKPTSIRVRSRRSQELIHGPCPASSPGFAQGSGFSNIALAITYPVCDKSDSDVANDRRGGNLKRVSVNHPLGPRLKK